MFDHNANARQGAHDSAIYGRYARDELVRVLIDDWGHTHREAGKVVNLSESQTRRVYNGNTGYIRAVDPRLGHAELAKLIKWWK